MDRETHIIKEIASTGGTSESSRIYVIITVHSGKSEVVIEKTITKRMPVQEYNKAVDLYEKLNHGNGRRCYELDEIANEELINRKDYWKYFKRKNQ